MSNARPRVTVLMAAYNAQAHLTEALQSVAQQRDFAQWECVVVDDGSTDGTAEILHAFAQREPRARILTLPQNGGLTHALNVGLDAAQGAYIARLDADDRMLPTRLAQQVAYLDAHPDAVAVGGDCQLIDEAGRPMERRALPRSDDEIAWLMLFHNPFFHSAMTFRARLDDAPIRYDPAFHTAQDYALWSQLQRHARLANLAKVVCEHRVHNQRVSAARKQEQQQTAEAISTTNLQRLAPQRRLDSAQLKRLRELMNCPPPLDSADAQADALMLLDLLAAFVAQQRARDPYESCAAARRFVAAKLLRAIPGPALGRALFNGLLPRAIRLHGGAARADLQRRLRRDRPTPPTHSN
ncbi:glycosyltransferase family 2 protein [Magnetofaba australis]|uniref:Putative glycosyl transferase family protein n=1 Tax=Magnetofaba australis IT-1 TaxID=1434232 RepID=A0A1Y2K1K0_9PROT|nr:glycosyltransferase [Magnetofaba australis]OSM00062.1 putative glycosyl transferase family protein [Magnetofaba australis IT-1]